MPPTPAQMKALTVAARKAAGRAYAPYSRFKVGAAILTPAGKIYAGCNVENASYGLCNCAERSAIFGAVSNGEKRLKIACVVVFTPTDTPTAPCGACRQVIYEFGPSARVISICRSRARLDHAINELLPNAFGPDSLI